MSARPAVSALAPFRVRSYRFQWPADLATSWAFEMETLILGWYIMVETKSVLLLSLFASMQYLGTLLAPVFGVLGQRVGNKRLVCAMRGTYVALSSSLMTLALSGVLAPLYVFIISALMGLLRPSDLVMRYSLIGEIMPARQLMGATSISRTTQDSARIMGAMTGAGLAVALGTGPAYIAIACLYATSFVLTLNISNMRRVRRPDEARTSPWRDLRDVIAYVWNTPPQLGALCIAFLVNLTAYPLVIGLMPYVAREIYLTDQTGLGYLIASFACGALIGSITLSHYGHRVRPGRMMLVFCAAWYVMIIVFARMPTLPWGSAFLVLAGLSQSLCLVPVSAMLLRTADERYRGGVMGVRQLMIYGVPIGLVIAGPLIARYGYPATATLYSIVGLISTALIGVHWRRHLWRADAPANSR